jgi:hypothetical protein
MSSEFGVPLAFLSEFGHLLANRLGMLSIAHLLHSLAQHFGTFDGEFRFSLICAGQELKRNDCEDFV